MTYKSYTNRVLPQLQEKLQKGAIDAAMQIQERSDELVPVDDGELIGSSTVSNDQNTVMVSYGSDPVSAVYAVEQHENPFYNHAPGKSYKFLEIAFNELVPKVSKIIARKLK